MKKILILVGSRKKRVEYLPLFLRSAPTGSLIYEAGSLEELSFLIAPGNISITNYNGTELSNYDLVVFRTVGARKYVAVAVAAYCKANGIEFIDSLIDHIAAVDDENKLAEMVVLGLSGLPIPATSFGPAKYLSDKAAEIGFPVIVKAIDGKKGRSNYLVETTQEVAGVTDGTTNSAMILQQYIPNEQDYRILILNYKHVVVTLRKRKGDATHLNNVSAGGEEILVTDYTGLEGAIETSIKAARTLGLEVAGVDLVIDKNTQRPYIMEVNRAPELTLEAELSGYFSALEDIVSETNRKGES